MKRFHKTVKVVIVGSILTLVIGLVVASSQSTGTEKYHGVKNDAALAALKVAERRDGGHDWLIHPFTISHHIESIQAISRKDHYIYCPDIFQFHSEKDLNAPDTYDVTWSYKTFFGIKTNTGRAYVCRDQ